jgi:hypothetical protein
VLIKRNNAWVIKFCALETGFCDDMHLPKISYLLLSKLSLFMSFKMPNLSSKHKLQHFDPPVYEIVCFKIVHLMV